MPEIMKRLIQIKDVLTSPNSFFSRFPKDSFESIYGFYLVLLSFFTLMNIGFTLLSYFFFRVFLYDTFLYNIFFAEYNIFLELLIYLFGFLIGTISIFLSVLILQGLLYIFGARESYLKTFQLAVYAYIPLLLFGGIPFLGVFLGLIWSLVLLIFGVQKTHGLSLTRAILAILVVPLTAILLLFIGVMSLLLIGIFLAFLFAL